MPVGDSRQPCVSAIEVPHRKHQIVDCTSNDASFRAIPGGHRSSFGVPLLNQEADLVNEVNHQPEEDFGLQFNPSYVSTGKRSARPVNCPTWAKPMQVEDWQHRGIVVWQNSTQRIVALSGTCCLTLESYFRLIVASCKNPTLTNAQRVGSLRKGGGNLGSPRHTGRAGQRPQRGLAPVDLAQ